MLKGITKPERPAARALLGAGHLFRGVDRAGLYTSPGMRRDGDESSTFLGLEEQHAAVHGLHSVLLLGKPTIMSLILIRPPDTEVLAPVACI